MHRDDACDACCEPIDLGATACPHCARPSLFPNVRLAETPAYADALEQRYRAQIARASAARRSGQLDAFEATMKQSQACKALRRWDLRRLAASHTATAATYYQQIEGRQRLPDTDEWEILRRVADAKLFGSNAKDVHFAALSVNGNWPTNYGDGAVFFKESMIAHRASVFEENLALWARGTAVDDPVPPGKIATWGNRHKLAVAKLGESICSGSDDAVDRVLVCGATTADDSLIEVHIFGGFTIRSAQSVAIRTSALDELGDAMMREHLSTLHIALLETA